MNDHFSLRMSLLDKQVADCDRLPIGRVDDVEIDLGDDGEAPCVTALLTGAQALGERLGRRAGRWMAGAAERLRPSGSGPTRIEADLVDDTDPMITLRVSLDELPDTVGLERWLGQHVIGPIPGARDESE